MIVSPLVILIAKRWSGFWTMAGGREQSAENSGEALLGRRLRVPDFSPNSQETLTCDAQGKQYQGRVLNVIEVVRRASIVRRGV